MKQALPARAVAPRKGEPQIAMIAVKASKSIQATALARSVHKRPAG